MKNAVLSAAAVGLMAAALLFLGFCLYQLTLPDVVTMELESVTVTQMVELSKHSHETWIWTTVGAIVGVGAAAIIAAIIAGEIE